MEHNVGNTTKRHDVGIRHRLLHHQHHHEDHEDHDETATSLHTTSRTVTPTGSRPTLAPLRKEANDDDDVDPLRRLATTTVSAAAGGRVPLPSPPEHRRHGTITNIAEVFRVAPPMGNYNHHSPQQHAAAAASLSFDTTSEQPPPHDTTTQSSGLHTLATTVAVGGGAVANLCSATLGAGKQKQQQQCHEKR
jgi:hypothetical protein